MTTPAAAVVSAGADAARDFTSFIEVQLPVSKLSKECYKERKAGAGQTLTTLGSYWKGRKPLILVRAVVLGLLLPTIPTVTARSSSSSCSWIRKGASSAGSASAATP